MAGNILHCVSHDWILDTGANEHMFDNYSLLLNSKSVTDSTKSKDATW